MLLSNILVLLSLVLVKATTYEYRNLHPSSRLRQIAPFHNQTRYAVELRITEESIVFFGNKDGSLEYWCGDLCDIYIRRGRTTPTATYVDARLNMYSVPPAASTHIRLCAAPVRYFWRRPIYSVGDLYCISWRNYISREYIAQPRDAGAPSMEVVTWYMTKDNFREMRENKITEVMFPLFEEEVHRYWFPLSIYFYLGDSRAYDDTISCQIEKSGYIVWAQGQILASHVYRYSGEIEGNANNSGVYAFTCTTLFHDEFAFINSTKVVSMSLRITFFTGPKILIKDLVDDNMIILSSQNSFNVSVYSTFPVTSFQIERSDGISSDGGTIVTVLESQTPYTIKTMYGVEIPTATEGLRATYVLTTISEDGRSDTQIVTVLKPRGVSVSVSSREVVAVEGDRVRIDCTAVGDTVVHIEWTRSYGVPKRPQTEDVSSGVLRLVLPEARLEHSGVFVCTASDFNHTKSVSVSLTVWPSESDDSVTYRVDREGDSLKMSQLEVHHEWQLDHPPHSVAVVVVAILALITGGVLLTLLVAAVIYCLHRLINRGEVARDGPDPSSPPSTEHQSTEQLWNNIVPQTSVQMNQVMPTTAKQSRDDLNTETNEAIPRIPTTKESVASNQLSDTLQETVRDDRKKRRKKEKSDKLITEIETADESAPRDKKQRKKEKKGIKESKSEPSQYNKDSPRSSRPNRDVSSSPSISDKKRLEPRKADKESTPRANEETELPKLTKS